MYSNYGINEQALAKWGFINQIKLKNHSTKSTPKTPARK